MGERVFICYSRHDERKVAAHVALLRSAGIDVFQDRTAIEPGDEWEHVIEEQLRGCSRMLVYWSKRARQSKWVEREYTTAHELDLRIVPVALDRTPLPELLAAKQGVMRDQLKPGESGLPRVSDRRPRVPRNEDSKAIISFAPRAGEWLALAWIGVISLLGSLAAGAIVTNLLFPGIPSELGGAYTCAALVATVGALHASLAQWPDWFDWTPGFVVARSGLAWGTATVLAWFVTIVVARCLTPLSGEPKLDVLGGELFIDRAGLVGMASGIVVALACLRLWPPRGAHAE